MRFPRVHCSLHASRLTCAGSENVAGVRGDGVGARVALQVRSILSGLAEARSPLDPEREEELLALERARRVLDDKVARALRLHRDGIPARRLHAQDAVGQQARDHVDRRELGGVREKARGRAVGVGARVDAQEPLAQGRVEQRHPHADAPRPRRLHPPPARPVLLRTHLRVYVKDFALGVRQRRLACAGVVGPVLDRRL
eukprot:34497-Rhodomonas_salina.1